MVVMPTRAPTAVEVEALDLARRGELALPPVQFDVSLPPGEGPPVADLLVTARFQSRRFEFAAVCKSSSTPRIVRDAATSAAAAAERMGRMPMLIVPYLADQRLRELEALGVSGLDLCGNGVLIVPDRLFVFRTGAANRYPSSAPIKNIYRRTSSLAARVFLLRPTYPSLKAVVEHVGIRGGTLAKSTVSKVVGSLKEDLLVTEEGAGLRLLNPNGLLDKLTENFQTPDVSRRIRVKWLGNRNDMLPTLVQRARDRRIRLALTGAGSTFAYAVMARSDALPLYCDQIGALLDGLPVDEGSRFPDIELLQTDDDTVYFDVRDQDGYPVASPIQAWLELMQGDKRDKEAAGQIRAALWPKDRR